MTEIILKYFILSRNCNNIEFSIASKENLLGYYVENVNQTVSTYKSHLSDGDVILELNGISIAYMTTVEQCCDEIKRLTKSEGCVITIISRLDFERLCKTNYIISTQLSQRCKEIYDEVLAQFLNKEAKINFKEYLVKLTDPILNKNCIIQCCPVENKRFSITNLSKYTKEQQSVKKLNIRRSSAQSFKIKADLFNNL